MSVGGNGKLECCIVDIFAHCGESETFIVYATVQSSFGTIDELEVSQAFETEMFRENPAKTDLKKSWAW